MRVAADAGLRYGRKYPDGVMFHTFRHHAESRIMRSDKHKSLKPLHMVLAEPDQRE